MTVSWITSARTWTRLPASRRFGVVAIVVAQEFQWVTGARNRSRIPGVASYDFVKEERRVNAYYFYVHDRQFGAWLHQDLQLLSLSGQGVGKRARVG